MSLFEKQNPLTITYYLRKCGQHLKRTVASYDLVVAALQSTDPESFVATHPGLFEADVAVEHRSEKMKGILLRSHFLLLKVEFELFLHLLALESWRVALLRARAHQGDLERNALRELSSKVREGDSMALLEHDHFVEALCALVVPSHGLDRIADSMKLVGTDAKSLFNAHERSIWPQIQTAFAVRHLIEHRNGRIDRNFRTGFSSALWGNSSWGKRIQDRSESLIITVTEEDFRATANAMLGALDAVTPRCQELEDQRTALTS